MSVPVCMSGCIVSNRKGRLCCTNAVFEAQGCYWQGVTRLAINKFFQSSKPLRCSYTSSLQNVDLRCNKMARQPAISLINAEHAHYAASAPTACAGGSSGVKQPPSLRVCHGPLTERLTSLPIVRASTGTHLRQVRTIVHFQGKRDFCMHFHLSRCCQ